MTKHLISSKSALPLPNIHPHCAQHEVRLTNNFSCFPSDIATIPRPPCPNSITHKLHPPPHTSSSALPPSTQHTSQATSQLSQYPGQIQHLTLCVSSSLHTSPSMRSPHYPPLTQPSLIPPQSHCKKKHPQTH